MLTPREILELTGEVLAFVCVTCSLILIAVAIDVLIWW